LLKAWVAARALNQAEDDDAVFLDEAKAFLLDVIAVRRELADGAIALNADGLVPVGP